MQNVQNHSEQTSVSDHRMKKLMCDDQKKLKVSFSSVELEIFVALKEYYQYPSYFWTWLMNMTKWNHRHHHLTMEQQHNHVHDLRIHILFYYIKMYLVVRGKIKITGKHTSVEVIEVLSSSEQVFELIGGLQGHHSNIK